MRSRTARAFHWARRYLTPPRGIEVRRLVAIYMFAVGIPRLPIIHDYVYVGSQRIEPAEVFGIPITILAIALLVTTYHGRLQWYGRLIAALCCAAWVTLAVSTISATSFLIEIAIAAVMFTEAGTWRD